MKTRSSSSARPETTFFVDRDLGRRFVEILREAGLDVEAHRDHFADDTPDEEWLHAIAAHGWVALTHDAKIRYTSAAREVIFAQGARVIVIKGKAPAAELAANFVQSLTAVDRFLRRHPAPFIAKLRRDAADPAGPGRIDLWLRPS